ncbi:unnamed protein product, partial [Amoebophrya sp. A120]|eukprot:GSA120T00010942001.1
MAPLVSTTIGREGRRKTSPEWRRVEDEAFSVLERVDDLHETFRAVLQHAHVKGLTELQKLDDAAQVSAAGLVREMDKQAA